MLPTLLMKCKLG